MSELTPAEKKRLAEEMRAIKLLLAENRAILRALAKSLDRRFRHGRSVR